MRRGAIRRDRDAGTAAAHRACIYPLQIAHRPLPHHPGAPPGTGRGSDPRLVRQRENCKRAAACPHQETVAGTVRRCARSTAQHVLVRRLVALTLAALCLHGAQAADERSEVPEVRIGVLAYKGSDAVQQDWTYVTRHLQASIPGIRFTLADYDQAGLTRAVQSQAIAFAITSSGHYVALEHSDGASRIATIESPWTDSPRQAIGSAIVVRSASPLHDLADLAGKNVMAVASDAFGGYQIAARELKEAGIDPARDFASLRYSGFPSQQIIAAIRTGTADAGIVRTCLLEQMMAQGQVRADELRVITTRPIPGFRCASSSRLYPDWP